ncbi:MAG: NADH-quinone oxidoreductase subunit K [Clostridia bacterium]|nr:NADH-quinone oxidoreductase subunit K [Clostridia bacterium]
MLSQVYSHLDELTAVALFGIGFTLLLLDKNLMKKIIGFSMMDSGIYLFLASYGYIESRLAPIYTEGVSESSAYVNPLPAGLVLTGIVVGVSVTAVMLGLTIRLYERYHSLDIDEIAEKIRREGK